MNRFTKSEISTLTNAFRNAGRGNVKKDLVAKDKGMWQPAVGSYRPKREIIEPNDQNKLNKIPPE